MGVIGRRGVRRDVFVFFLGGRISVCLYVGENDVV